MPRIKYSLKRTFRVEYCALWNAIDRCTRVNHPQYANYGQRGITVHEDFLGGDQGFQNFLAEVGPRPNDRMSLDRINNDLGYEPGNLRWSDPFQQSANRREQRGKVTDLGWGSDLVVVSKPGATLRRRWSPILELGDRRMTIIEWSNELGLSTSTIWQRYYRGWPIEGVLSPNLFKPNSPQARANYVKELN